MLFRSQVLFSAGVEYLQHLVGNVVLGIEVHHFLNNQVVFFGFRNLFNRFIGFVQHLLQLFVATAILIFLKLALLTLKIAPYFRVLLLAGIALTFGQSRCVALKLVTKGFQ